MEGADPEAVPEDQVLDAARAGVAGLHAWYDAGPGAEAGAAVVRVEERTTVAGAVADLADLVEASVVAERVARRVCR